MIKSEKMKMLALLSASTIIVSWGVMNINIPAMSQAFNTVPLVLVENLATVSSLFIMIAVLLSHKIAKYFGYKQTILIGLGLVGVSGLVPLFIENFYVIFTSRAVLGFGIGMFQSLLVSMNKYFFDGEQRTKMFGFQSACEGLGGVTLTLISGQLVKMGWQGLFYIYIIVIPVFILYAYFVPTIATQDIIAKNTNGKQKNDREAKRENGFTKTMLESTGYMLLVFALSVMYMILGIKVTSLMITKGFGTATDGATVLMFIGVGAMTSGLIFVKLVKRTKGLTLTIAYVVLALAMVVVGSADRVLLVSIGGLLAGFSFRTIIPYLLNHINSGAVANSSLVTSLVLVALNLGAFASPYGALLIEKITGNPTLSGTFYTISVILILMAIGSGLIKVVQSGKVVAVVQE